MSLFDAIILGIVQGITEFLPISSSTHLTIAKMLLGVTNAEEILFFDLSCHLGTIFAAALFFRSDIKAIFTGKPPPYRALFFFAALLPLLPCYFLLRPLRASAHLPGFCLLLTSLLLFTASFTKRRPEHACPKRKFRDVLFIGVMQAMALIPGISRSGSTISAALFRGWDVKDAVRFSFLLAIPTILGASFFECVKTLSSHSAALSFSLLSCVAGFAVSFGVGCLGVRMTLLITDKSNLRLFAWYCLGLGVSVIYLR